MINNSKCIAKLISNTATRTILHRLRDDFNFRMRFVPCRYDFSYAKKSTSGESFDGDCGSPTMLRVASLNGAH